MVTLASDTHDDVPMDVPTRDVTDAATAAPHVTTTYCYSLPDCDINVDQAMADQTDQQQMVLRSVRKTHQIEKSKKGKIVSEELLVDSDDENNLVIDCDIPSEENHPSKPTVAHGKLRDRKNMLLRPKIQNDNEDDVVVEKQQIVDALQEPGDHSSSIILNKKKRKIKFRTRWYKAKIRKGGLKTMSKPVKRLLQRTKLKDKTEPEPSNISQADEMIDDENVSEKNVCPICDKEFFDTHSFTIHIREHNTDKFSHVCKICSKQLSSASSLDRHMYVHSGERPFECSVCKLRFTTNGNMHRHMKIHEGNEKLKVKGSAKRLLNHFKDHCSLSGSSNQGNDDEDAPVPKKIRYNIFKSLNKDITFKCPVCGKRFSSMDLVKSHMVIHSDDPIKCSTCNVTFEDYAVYENHPCPENGESSLKFPNLGFQDLTFIEFSSSKFSLVAKHTCENRSRNSSSAFLSWECHKCGKAFPSNEVLYQHELSHELDNMSCHTCKCHFSSVKNFQDHQLKHRIPEQCSNDPETKDPSSKEDFLAMLELCSNQVFNHIQKKPCEKIKHFDSMQYFVHGACSTERKNGESDNDFADIKSIISLTSKTVIPDMRASPVTASPASPPSAMTGDAPVSPIIEGSANPSADPPFLGEGSNSESFKLDDNASKDSLFGEYHDCKKCSETFPTAIALRQHMREHAKSAPLHKCNFCPYESVDKSTLKRHMRKHNGEHPFKCSICDYVFTTKANGHRHVKNKHKLSEQEATDAVVYNPNMLEAKDSDGASNDPASTETVCKYCKKNFGYNRVLRHHLRSQSNSCSYKPYICNICRQGFSTKNNCIRHITNHHPENKDNAKELVIVNEISSAGQHDSSNGSEGESTQGTEAQPLNLTLYCENEESSHSVEHDDLELTGSDAEMVVAQSLVSLSELIPPQEKPLDLTLCALDLTLKDNGGQNSNGAGENSNCLQAEVLNLCTVPSAKALASKEKKSESSDQQSPVNLEVVSQPLNLSKATPLPVSLVKGTPEKNIPQVNISSQVLSLVCLPQVLTPIHSLIGNKASIPVVYSTPKTASTELIPIDSMQTEENQKNSQKVKKFSCDICFKGFTLKSNRERHIKNHHPEHARPPRSRNYIPTLSPTTVQKQSNAALSDRTRDALRVALIAKTNNGSKTQESVKQKDNQKAQKKTPTSFRGQFSQSSVASLSSTSKKGRPNGNINVQSPSKDKTDINDLASVSDVIDAVNCPDFKRYLLDAKGASDSSGMDEPIIPEAETVSENNASLKCNTAASEKKSSYAKCSKSIYCTYCKRKFPWKSSLSRHFLTHTGLKPHKCPKCPLSFTTKSNRDRHLFRQHSGVQDSATLSDKPYKCSDCPNNYFSTKGKLKKHFFSKHFLKNGSAPTAENGTFKIDFNSSAPSKGRSSLSNKFGKKNKSATLRELDSDMDIMPLECHLCMNTFKAQEDLLSHLKEVHPLEIGVSNGNTSNHEDFDISSIIKVEPADPDEVVGMSESEQVTDRNANTFSFPCIQCSLQCKSADELCEHAKSHALNLSATMPSKNAGAKSTTTPTKDNFTSPKKSNANLPKKTPNSLLYLFAAAQQARSSDTVASKPKSSKSQKVKSTPQVTSEATTEGDNSLILNLLGIKDSEFVEEMIDSAVRSRVKKEKADV